MQKDIPTGARSQAGHQPCIRSSTDPRGLGSDEGASGRKAEALLHLLTKHKPRDSQLFPITSDDAWRMQGRSRRCRPGDESRRSHLSSAGADGAGALARSSSGHRPRRERSTHPSSPPSTEHSHLPPPSAAKPSAGTAAEDRERQEKWFYFISAARIRNPCVNWLCSNSTSKDAFAGWARKLSV